MSRTAVIFPGQGAQYAGMAKDFYEKYPVCREVFQTASLAGGLDAEQLCFTENEKLHQTEYTQIAMLTAEIAMWKAAQEQGLQADMAAGLSLGEYGALAVSGAVELSHIFALIRKRGIFMQEAVPTGGAMTAVLGLEREKVEEICALVSAQAKNGGMVSVANYNCPGQLVITGEEQAVTLAAQQMKALGAKRCVPLKVSGPFHSPMLREAAVQLGMQLATIPLQEIRIPYFSNVTGEAVEDKSQIKGLLAAQVSSPVKWQQCVEGMIAAGADTFVEIGPGKTLSSFVRKINGDVKIFNIEKAEDLEKLVC